MASSGETYEDPSAAEEQALEIGRDSLIQGRINVERLLSIAEQHDKTWADYFQKEASTLIKEKSFHHPGDPHTRYIDIVRDVINLLPVHWISEEIVR